MSDSLSLNEVPEQNARPSGFPKLLIVVGLLVLAHVGFGADFYPFFLGPRKNEIVAGLGLGALLSQPTTLVIRFCGFRMIREPKARKQT